MLLQVARSVFDTLKDSGMKRIRKLSVAEKEADCFRSFPMDPACLCVGSKTQVADGLGHPFLGVPADLRSSVQDPGNSSDSDPRITGNVTDSSSTTLWIHLSSSFLWLPRFRVLGVCISQTAGMPEKQMDAEG